MNFLETHFVQTQTHLCAHTHTQMHEYIWKFVNKDFHGRPEGNLLICLKTFSQLPVFPQSSLFPLRITTDRVCVRVWPCKCDHVCVHAVCLCVPNITAKCDHACVCASLSVCSQHYCKVWPCVCVCVQVCLCVSSITAKCDHAGVRASLSVCSHHYWKVWPRVCACKSVCVFPPLLKSVTMHVCVQVCLCVPSITAKCSVLPPNAEAGLLHTFSSSSLSWLWTELLATASKIYIKITSCTNKYPPYSSSASWPGWWSMGGGWVGLINTHLIPAVCDDLVNDHGGMGVGGVNKYPPYPS